MSDSSSTTSPPGASRGAAGRSGPVGAQRDLAAFLARCYASPGEVLNDLERATLIRLWKAARHPEPGRGTPFATDAGPGAPERRARAGAVRQPEVRRDLPRGAPPA